MAQRSFYVRKTLSVRVWFCKNSEESSLFCFYLNFQSNSVEKVWIKGSLWALLFFFFLILLSMLIQVLDLVNQFSLIPRLQNIYAGTKKPYAFLYLS